MKGAQEIEGRQKKVLWSKTETESIHGKKIASIHRLRYRYRVRCVLVKLLRGRGSHTLTQTFSRAVSVGGDRARIFGDISEDRLQDGQVDSLSALMGKKTHVRSSIHTDRQCEILTRKVGSWSQIMKMVLKVKYQGK